MKLIIVLFAISAFAGVATAISFENLSFMWEAWKIQHSKAYSAAEEAMRFEIFCENVAKIELFNAENDLTKQGINKFTDLTPTEFKNLHSRCAKFESDEEHVRQNILEIEEVNALPASLDWRTQGAVTPVKNQQQCGSCWTFSTTGLLEGWHYIQNKTLMSFSEQQIVDCDTKTNQGCNGGYPYLAVQYCPKGS